MEVAGVIQMRMASQRCVNKNLRPFGDTTMARLALEKFVKCKELSNFYVAVHEQEFIDLANEVEGVKIIKRSRESAYGEKFEVVQNYLKEIPEEFIININSTCPFLSTETIDGAVRHFKETKPASMIPVIRTYGWYFNEDGDMINNDENALLANSKMLKPIFKHSCAFVMYSVPRAIRDKTYWSFSKNDPALFEIPEEEAYDIDTETDFQIAEALYRVKHGLV